MTFAELCEIVARITYKPAWVVKVYDVQPDTAYQITLNYQTTDSGGEADGPITISSTTLIPYESLTHLQSAAIVTEVRRLILRAELHEVDEWLRYRGEQVKNPHP